MQQYYVNTCRALTSLLVRHGHAAMVIVSAKGADQNHTFTNTPNFIVIFSLYYLALGEYCDISVNRYYRLCLLLAVGRDGLAHDQTPPCA